MKVKVKLLAQQSAHHSAPFDSNIINKITGPSSERCGVEINLASPVTEVSNSSTASIVTSFDKRNLKRDGEENGSMVCHIENKRFAGASNVNPDVPLLKKT